VGREYDAQFLADLPESVDLCGENGEFHTFVYDGPLFSWSIKLKRGEKVLREGRFYYCDLVPIFHGDGQGTVNRSGT
jgi:diphthamide synthase (EF-2-diphthine--ammonia ligase)